MEKLNYERPVLKKMNIGLMNKFGSRTEFHPVKEIDGNSVDKIIENYGSPVYVISEKQIRKNIKNALRSFKTRYPKVKFAWSYKTNYLDAVCRIFHQEESWAEVVSGFEYQKAIENGVPGDKIIFNGPDKNFSDLEIAISNDSLIHIDHFDELYHLIELAEDLNKKPRVAIRINMDTGDYPIWDRFGFNYENGQAWNAVNKIISSGKLELTGLHTHIGTFMLNPNSYAIATGKMCEMAYNIKKQFNVLIKYLDLGGGFPSTNTLKGAYLPGTDIVPSIEEYADAITNALLEIKFRREEMPMLILETGRALIDDAGYLLGTVLANKRLTDGRRATIVDFGVNLLITSFWYDHKITPSEDFSQHTEDMVIFGNLCMNIDVIRESVNLPLLNKGDHLVVQKVGAYNMTQWMQFISLRPKILLIDNKGIIHVIRENETLDYLKSIERIPEHLNNINI